MSNIPECHEWQKESPGGVCREETRFMRSRGECLLNERNTAQGSFWSHKMGLKKERKLGEETFFFFLMEPVHTQSEILNKR